MTRYFADFHIHIGRSSGHPVKMAAAPSLTVERVLTVAREQKGLDVITIIDAVTRHVLQELLALAADGRLVPLPGGGLLFENGLVVLLGSEIEIAGPEGGAAHFGAWFGQLEAAVDFLDWLATVQKNPSLSSQRARVAADRLQAEVAERGGMFIVHHAFTPHKGLYGNCVDRMADMLDPNGVDALELGLSADTDMADCLEELSTHTFLTNSDAHSLPKLAREYNVLSLADPSFERIRSALRRSGDDRITANVGLHVELGKYHRTFCLNCERLWAPGAARCACGSERSVKGVFDRLCEIRDWERPIHPSHRPPYVHQVPLEFIPGLGKVALERLLQAFGSEMAVLHDATPAALADVVGDTLADKIIRARTGQVEFMAGGGGQYGKPIFSA